MPLGQILSAYLTEIRFVPTPMEGHRASSLLLAAYVLQLPHLIILLPYTNSRHCPTPCLPLLHAGVRKKKDLSGGRGRQNEVVETFSVPFAGTKSLSSPDRDPVCPSAKGHRAALCVFCCMMYSNRPYDKEKGRFLWKRTPK